MGGSRGRPSPSPPGSPVVMTCFITTSSWLWTIHIQCVYVYIYNIHTIYDIYIYIYIYCIYIKLKFCTRDTNTRHSITSHQHTSLHHVTPTHVTPSRHAPAPLLCGGHGQSGVHAPAPPSPLHQYSTSQALAVVTTYLLITY